jgi:RsiW-degrading membrane proteinase PrsW (M82 family)
MNRSDLPIAPPKLARQPAFYVFLMLLMSCFGLVGLEQVGYVTTRPAAWLLSVVLLAATAMPAGVIIYRLDQFEPEPASLITVALLWGGVVALAFAALVNTQALDFLQHMLPAVRVDSWAAALVAPVDEELYKGAGLVIIYLMARSEFDSVMDGLVYGAMIGLGFQVMENVQYFMLAAGDSGGHTGPVVTMFFLRVVLSGLYSHMLFSGLMGFGFAYFVTQQGRTLARRLGVFALFAFLSWAAHFVWNSPWLESLMTQGTGAFALALVIKGLPFLTLLVLLVVFARRREGRAFAALMKSEVGSDAVSAEEFQVLRSSRRRRRALRRMKKSGGRSARSVLKQLMREQMNLALFHAKVRSTEHPALEAQRDVVRHLKGRMAGAGQTG